ncbi:PLP-dependent transferase, partial [Streptomyces sp. SID2955]|nr:PLP-dependent transferase [Streptomyces sp. SID2955]
MDTASTGAYDDVRAASRALATEAVHAGRDDLARLGLHTPPIDLSTTYPSHDSRAEAARIDAFAT